MDKEIAFDFYKQVKEQEISWLNLHYQYSQQYLKLIAAILAISIGAIYQFKNEPLIIFTVITGPSLNVLLCITAIKMCNRFYQRFLEGVSIQAKIEPLLGLNNSRYKNKQDNYIENNKKSPFPDDIYYLPERWIESRKHNTSLEFIKENMKSGANKYVQLSFILLLFVNIVLIISIFISVLHLFKFL